jgi:hypothetical protein
MSDPLKTYTFLPWVRQGLGGRIDTVDPLGPSPGAPVERASIRIDFDVNSTPVGNPVQLIGPGDVLGINPRAIVKTEPRHWITNFEPNFFPYVEFYDEDFPWRYTPATAAAGHRLRPWMVLIAVTDDEFHDAGVLQASDDRSAPPIPIVEIVGDAALIFPPADQTWAWAHVHASQDVSNDGARTPEQTVDALEDLIRQNPDLASSRLLCARKLRPTTAYHALVLPAFEIGRQAGLGQSTAGLDNLAPSWGLGQTKYPVLYRWYFRTADRGDFEFLVDLLDARPVPADVGIRDMDVQRPDFGVRGLSDPPVMGLEGALRKPGAVSRPSVWPPPATTPVLLTDLEAKVNLAADLMADPPAGGHPDPVVTLPLYGRWHAMVDRMESRGTGWVNEVNADPRLRSAAGMGTLVIQTNQEQYMQQAWQQVGDILEANRRIRQAQLALSAGVQILRKNLRPLPAHDVLSFTAAVHARVMGSPLTIRQQMTQSRIPMAAVEPAFRSLVRPRGRLSRETLPDAGSRPTNIVARLNEGAVTAAVPKVTPPGQIGLNEIADAVAPNGLPDWLRVLLRQPLLLWGLIALLVILLFFVAGPLIAVIVAVAAAAAAPPLARLARHAIAADGLRDASIVPASVERVPPRASFVITAPGTTAAVSGSAAATTASGDSIEASRFRQATIEMSARVSTAEPVAPAPVPIDIRTAALKITTAIDPTVALPARLHATLRIPDTYRTLKPVQTIASIMAHPSFKDAMYKPLRDLSADLLVPNLNQIPNNTITLMESNARFIEGYMLGLNHEMSRELLWREYPTDQRGSYFRQFWDVADTVIRDASTPAEREESMRDIQPIHEWNSTSALGTHDNRDLPTGAEPGDARLVLVVRGELLKKYPTTLVYAQKARWGVDEETGLNVRLLDATNPAVNVLSPMFKAEVTPDIHFFGFNLTQSQARGSTNTTQDPGWFIVLQERPGEPRFAMDITNTVSPPAVTRWRELTWNHLGDPESIHAVDLATVPTTNIPGGSVDSRAQWGSNAADMAYILFQDPVMVAFHAADMIEP